MRFEDCPGMFQGWRKGLCRRCGGALEGRRVYWCSDECSVWWLQNHSFTSTRRVAWQRSQIYPVQEVFRDYQPHPWDGRCWGDDGEGPHLIAMGRPSVGHVCEQCERVVDGIRDIIEIDHIEPANGAHQKLSCVHHLENVRALCVPCHRARTKEQAGERAREKRAAKYAESLFPELGRAS